MSITITVDDDAPKMSPLEERATILAYAGLVPFFATALIIWLTPNVFTANFASLVVPWTMYYAAIILSFMGGVRWGLAMLDDKKVSEYVTLGQLTNSVIPALVGWIALMPGNLIPFVTPGWSIRYLLVLAAFLYLMEVDTRSSRDGFAPAWYGPMRRKITFFLAMAMILIMIRLFLWSW
jgi:hypothetical protein